METVIESLYRSSLKWNTEPRLGTDIKNVGGLVEERRRVYLESTVKECIESTKEKKKNRNKFVFLWITLSLYNQAVILGL